MLTPKAHNYKLIELFNSNINKLKEKILVDIFYSEKENKWFEFKQLKEPEPNETHQSIFEYLDLKDTNLDNVEKDFFNVLKHALNQIKQHLNVSRRNRFLF